MIDNCSAKQFLQARLEAPGKCGTQRRRQLADLLHLSRDAREPVAQLGDEMLPFRAAHLIEFREGFAQAGFERLPQPFLLFGNLRDSAVHSGDHTGEAQQGHHIQFPCAVCSFHQRFRRAQIRLGKFLINLHGSCGPRLGVDVDFQMAAMNAVAHNLAQRQVIEIKTFRQPQLQIEKPVIHALDGDADGPAMFFMAGLGVTGH